MSNIEQHVSPDGQRMVIARSGTLEVWLARRLPPVEAREALVMAAQWHETATGGPRKGLPRRHRDAVLSIVRDEVPHVS